AEPPFKTLAAVIVAWISPDETKLVRRSCPLNRTTEFCTKFDPVTARVNGPLPAVTVFGLSAVIAGVGLGGTVICKMAAFDVPPPGGGEKTVTLALPGVAITDAETSAVS